MRIAKDLDEAEICSSVHVGHILRPTKSAMTSEELKSITDDGPFNANKHQHWIPLYQWQVSNPNVRRQKLALPVGERTRLLSTFRTANLRERAKVEFFSQLWMGIKVHIIGMSPGDPSKKRSS